MNKNSIEAIYPLSPMQEGLLFHTIYAPESGAYFEQLDFNLQGALNIPAFQRAWQYVIEQHSILRTLFVWRRRDKPLQIVRRQVPLPWAEQNWQGQTPEEQQQRLDQFLYQDRRQGFDLEKAPLMRLTLIQMAEDSYHLIWSFHHLLLDGWSTSLVIKQVFAAYRAFCWEDQPRTPRSRPYRDYIVWLQHQDSARAENFWRQSLRGFSSPTRLQAYQPNIDPLDLGQRYAEQQHQLSSITTSALQTLARQQQVTLNTVIQAAWALLLSRYSADHDVVFGATTAGRPAELIGIEDMVGLFINTLPVRVQVDFQMPLLNWLKSLQAQQAEARQYEYTPLAQIQRWSELPGGQPLFESLLIFENYPINNLDREVADQLAIEEVRFYEKTNYPLTLMIIPGPELRLHISYNSDYFEPEMIGRILSHLENLLEGMVAYPAARLLDLPLLTKVEEQQMLAAWNQTQVNDLEDMDLPQLFEKQVAQTPDTVAVVFENGQLTYRELNERANQLAHYLAKLGVGPEVRVGICMERSLEMMIGLFGILKAGGAYVPLDPTYPQERLAFMLDDARLPVLLTKGHLKSLLPAWKAKIIALDTDWQIIAQANKQNIAARIINEQSAYLIYTSGSTGQPKGVQIPHRALSNFLRAMRRQLELTAQDTLLAVTTLSFDIAALELFLPLTVGAKVVIVSRAAAGDSMELQQQLDHTKATIMQATPATWRMLLSAGWRPSRQMKILCGGETLPQDLAGQLCAEGTAVWNLYGPTETTIWSTSYKIDPIEKPVSIGRPIDNTQIYLLDAQLRPVPTGVPGELHIGGLGLARGYLNRPELTAEKFIPDPFSRQPGARLYKTGDLARYLADGRLEYLQRLDHQVKIRGFRIELGEIETVLASHPAVTEAVVVDREDQSGSKHLIAYFVPAQAVSPGLGELRNFLKAKLPDYMIPSAFIKLEAIPLTPNGKINRQALPMPDSARSGLLERCYVAPRTDIERLLVTIWADVLGLEQIGIYDDFFELGGHSLLATQLIFRLREAFQLELPLRYLFESGHIAGLAQLLTQMRQAGIEGKTTDSTVVDLDAEVVLDNSIRPGSAKAVAQPKAIFLTGATGFLGTFLLSELLQQTEADLYCLIRTADLEAGRQRIQQQLEAYQLWQPDFRVRIIPVNGDLGQPYLGLTPEKFQALAGQIELIYHNGALVNFVYPYARLKLVNVLGTQEVLRLASQVKIIPIHFISTTSVFDSPIYHNYEKRIILEDEEPLYGNSLLTGYAQSKWVAEKLVILARARGLPVSIYRPGVIIGDSRTGIWNTNDFTCRFLKGCIQLGYSYDLDELLQLTPVDFVSKAIVYLSKQPESQGQVFHVLTPHRLHQRQLDDWVRAAGYPLEQLPYRQWRERLIQVAGRSPEHPLYPLLPLFVEPVPNSDGLTVPEMFTQDREPQFDCQNLIRGLAGSGLVCPPVDLDLFNRYLSYFIRSGFLPKPAKN